MVYKPRERLKLAFKYLPLEFCIFLITVAIAWGVNLIVFKPTFVASTNVTILRKSNTKLSDQKKNKMRKEDIANVGQFNVVPRQRWVLYTASEYAYTHYGVWQNFTDLSESVSANAVASKPQLKISVTSSSKQIARENVSAFDYAVEKAVKTLDNYYVKSSVVKVNAQLSSAQKNVYKYSVISGIVLAVLTPYLISYVRGEEHHEKA